MDRLSNFFNFFGSRILTFRLRAWGPTKKDRTHVIETEKRVNSEKRLLSLVFGTLGRLSCFPRQCL